MYHDIAIKKSDCLCSYWKNRVVKPYNDAVIAPIGAKFVPDKVIDTKTYIGNYEFSGDTLLRLNTPYGYFHQGHYYVNAYDYQGNLVASGGNYACGVAQDNSYYPYGLNIYGLGNNKFTPYLFGGKEFEERQGLNLYDFHARTYAPDIARFMQPDPLATENMGVSPYTYCNGDPINFIDPSEEKVEFADSTNVEFIQAFHNAVSYLRENGASEWVDNIIKSDKVYVLEYAASNFSEASISVSPDGILNGVKIKWAHNIVIETWSGSYLSPAETLSHESDHAFRAETDLKGFIKDFETVVPYYGNKEDFRVIRGSERFVAEKLGKLGGMKYGRFNHQAKKFYVAIGVKGDFKSDELEVYGKKSDWNP